MAYLVNPASTWCAQNRTNHIMITMREPLYAKCHNKSLPCSPKVPCPPPVDESDWQTGQHSPSGIINFSQLLSSSHWISSHRTWPLSHTQIRHGSGFQMSLLVYTWPSAVQLTSSPEQRWEGCINELNSDLWVLCDVPLHLLPNAAVFTLTSQWDHTQGTLLVPNCFIRQVYLSVFLSLPNAANMPSWMPFQWQKCNKMCSGLSH